MALLDWPLFTDEVTRLAVAALLGGVLGLERELKGHWAGLRTHMMVSIGACIFIVVGQMAAGDDPGAVTRVVQGVATGVGFLGAGTILKLGDQRDIKGLTTASSIWLAAALGTVAGLAQYGLAAAVACVSLFVLAVLGTVERALIRPTRQRPANEHKSQQDKP